LLIRTPFFLQLLIGKTWPIWNMSNQSTAWYCLHATAITLRDKLHVQLHTHPIHQRLDSPSIRGKIYIAISCTGYILISFFLLLFILHIWIYMCVCVFILDFAYSLFFTLVVPFSLRYSPLYLHKPTRNLEEIHSLNMFHRTCSHEPRLRCSRKFIWK